MPFISHYHAIIFATPPLPDFIRWLSLIFTPCHCHLIAAFDVAADAFH